MVETTKTQAAKRQFSDEITTGKKTWRMRLGGCLDETNTRTRYGYNTRDIQLFQPNVMVRLANTGSVSIRNPWVVVNGKRRWRSVDEIISDIHAGYGPLTSNKEKLLAVWRFFCENLDDCRGGYAGSSDPVIALNSLGFEGCYHLCIMMNLVLSKMGLEMVRFTEVGDTDHWLPEVFYDGRYHMIDSCLYTFFLDRDGDDIAGIDDLQKDFSLTDATIHHNGPAGTDDDERTYYRDLIENDSIALVPQEFPEPRTMDFVLRPGESITRYWGTVEGKYALTKDESGGRKALTLEPSEGEITFEPDFAATPLGGVFHSFRNVRVEADGSVVPERAGMKSQVVLEVKSPYVITGGSVDLGFRSTSQSSVVTVDVLTPRANFPKLKIGGWTELYRSEGLLGETRHAVDLDSHVASHDDRLSFGYFVRITMTAPERPEDIALCGLRIKTNIQCATYSLPALELGDNDVSYSDDTGEASGKSVQLSMEWIERSDLEPPAAPELFGPSENQPLDLQAPDFRWADEQPRETADHHIQVSEYSDCKWPVSPGFERYISRTRYSGQQQWRPLSTLGLKPGRDYYWRVRSKNSSGVWSSWTPTTKFQVVCGRCEGVGV